MACRPRSCRGVCRSRTESTMADSPFGIREALAHQPAGGQVAGDLGGPRDVGLVDRTVALLAAAQLVATDDAAVLLGDRPGRLVAGRFPDDLLQGDRPAAGQATAGIALAEPDLEGRLLARRRRDRLEGGIEMTDVGRPEDDLGQQPGERARLEAGGPALAIDGGPGDPAAPAVEVDDDVARPAVGLDPGRDQLGRQGRRQPAEGRQRPARVAAQERIAGGHRRNCATPRRTIRR